MILTNNLFNHLEPDFLEGNKCFMSLKKKLLQMLPEAQQIFKRASGEHLLLIEDRSRFSINKKSDYSGFSSFFSKISLTSQHFVFLNFLLRRPFFSTHLWIFSGVFCFLQYSWQCLTKFSVFSSADTVDIERLKVNPIKIAVFFIFTPRTIVLFDTLTYLHYSASMYNVNIEPTEIFKVLSDRTRLRILRVLVSMPNEEVCLCDLTDALLEPEVNISRHLKVLRTSGLLMAEKEGRMVYHRLVPTKESKLFYNMIAKLPDPDGNFKEDLSKFKVELKKRSYDRCRRSSANKGKNQSFGKGYKKYV